VLELRDLRVTYDQTTRALDGVTMSLGTGLTGLLGPNGAGKSTLMQILATLRRPDAGTVTWHEGAHALDVVRDADRWRAQLGYLPQDFGLYPTLTVAETLAHFAALKGWHDPRARRTAVDMQLDAVGLATRRAQRVGGLSGGMRQRLGIAIALVAEPRLLIVDEPTSGLDPDERERLLRVLASRARDAIVLLSTHLVEDVEAVCDRVVMLDRGRVVLDGNPREETARLAGRVWQAVATPASLERWRTQWHVLRERLVGGDTIVRVAADRCPGSEFEPARPTMDDLYASVVGRAARR
jgi:ABC-type multidrug transport system ATPase subunit